MKVIGREKLASFCRTHADARKWIEAWLHEIEGTTWSKPADIRRRYASASFLAGNVVIFNVKGNEYRLETRVGYTTSVIAILWTGTHAAYDLRNRNRDR